MNETRGARPGQLLQWLAAAGMGALLMFLLDPHQGRRRVALARDRMLRFGRESVEFTQAGVRDLAHRAKGVVARARGAVDFGTVPNEILTERVRAALGHVCSHPHALHVDADAGRVILTGPVLESELNAVLQTALGVRGVHEVINRLEVHRSAEGVSALQGDPGGGRGQRGRAAWGPGARLLALAGGAGLLAYGVKRGGFAGLVAGATGGSLAIRALGDARFGSALLRDGGRAIDVEKSIRIAAAPQEVYEMWTDYENFPRFMSMVEEVRKLDEVRSHWAVKGPAGTRLEWDSVITDREPGRLIAWRTEPDAPVQHAGRVRFDETPGGTNVSVRMSYRPPAGAAGHVVASLLGRDPKKEMDADLMRMKSYIETGRKPRDAARANAERPRS